MSIRFKTLSELKKLLEIKEISSYELVSETFRNISSSKTNSFITLDEEAALNKAKDSKYAQSKIKGENKIRENFLEATIIKPSIVYSVDDNFTTRLLSLLSLLPIFPIYYKGETKYSPIHASEVAELIFFVISEIWRNTLVFS